MGSILLTRSKPVRATDAGATYLALARKMDALTADARAAPSAAAVPLAVNGDSLATWVLPALAPLAGDIRFTFHREDQDHSTALLRDGSVMAAITTEAKPVQGCTARALGTMRYRLVAAPDFAARWFATGVDAAAIARAPVVVFDAKDDLQHRYVRERWDTTIDQHPHYVPSSTDFVAAVEQGFGWATVPDLQSAGAAGPRRARRTRPRASPRRRTALAAMGAQHLGARPYRRGHLGCRTERPRLTTRRARALWEVQAPSRRVLPR